MSPHRIGALIIRHLYTYRRSPMRLMELIYWPLLDLLLWGFVSVYLQRYGAAVPNFVAFFIGALILWDILFRAQQGISVTYLEEVWSRNLMNLFVSPLTVAEFLFATVIVSLGKLAVAAVTMAGLALLFYHFNIFTLGVSLVPFVANLLLFGWSLGVCTTALVLRFGQAAESLAWVLAFLFQPFSAVFYPVSVLPPWMQAIARFLPSSHVFEGMRAVLNGHGMPWNHLAWAFGLNLLFVIGAVGFFYATFAQVKQRGLLSKVGE
ncbi:ABC-2 family transporter protein [compost metagenome]